MLRILVIWSSSSSSASSPQTAAGRRSTKSVLLFFVINSLILNRWSLDNGNCRCFCWCWLSLFLLVVSWVVGIGMWSTSFRLSSAQILSRKVPRNPAHFRHFPLLPVGSPHFGHRLLDRWVNRSNLFLFHFFFVKLFNSDRVLTHWRLEVKWWYSSE